VKCIKTGNGNNVNQLKIALKTREITSSELISGVFYPFETTVRLAHDIAIA
jgi:hypothetical protein